MDGRTRTHKSKPDDDSNDLSSAEFSSKNQISRRIEQALQITREEGPAALAKHKLRLQLPEAEAAVTVLNKEGIKVQPYDFPWTLGVWSGQDASGIPYKVLALREFYEALSTKVEADSPWHTFKGIRSLLPHLTQDNFLNLKINEHGTTLRGMYQNNFKSKGAAAALLYSVENDPLLERIQKSKLDVKDIGAAPKHYWRDHNGPTDKSRQMTEEVFALHAEKLGVDYKTKDGFRKILPHLQDFSRVKLNGWGTTPTEMVANAYAGSAAEAILNCIQHSKNLKLIREEGITAADLPLKPRGRWQDESGKPTALAASTIWRALLSICASRMESDIPAVITDISANMSPAEFSRRSFNYWGTTPAHALKAYGNKLGTALQAAFAAAHKDLATPEQARECLLKGIKAVLGVEENAAITSLLFRGLLRLSPDRFKSVGKEQDKFDSALSLFYNGDLQKALLDLVDKHKALVEVKRIGVKPYDFASLPLEVWRSKDGSASELAKSVMIDFTYYLAKQRSADLLTREGLNETLQGCTKEALSGLRINHWQTTAKTAFENGYKNDLEKVHEDMRAHFEKLFRPEQWGGAPFFF